MAANKQFKQSLKYLGGIFFHGLEYLKLGMRLSFVLAQLKAFLQYL